MLRWADVYVFQFVCVSAYIHTDTYEIYKVFMLLMTAGSSTCPDFLKRFSEDSVVSDKFTPEYDKFGNKSIFLAWEFWKHRLKKRYIHWFGLVSLTIYT